MNQREKYKHSSDLELVDLFQRTGNNEFLGALYNRYMHLIYGVCLKYLNDRETAKDAVMDIFETLPVKLTDQEILDFGAWIYVVSKNHCLMQLRKKQIIVNSEEVGHKFMETDTFVHLNNEVELTDHKINALEVGIKELPDEQRTCIKLFYFDEKSYAEIADQTGYGLNKVKSYIQNGKRNLKIWMEKQGE